LHDFDIPCRIFRVLSNLLVRFVSSSLSRSISNIGMGA